MKKVMFLVVLMIFAITLGAQTITLSNGDWKPYLAEDLPEAGFVSDIVREAFALKGVEVNYVFRPWKRAYEEALQGRTEGTLVWSKTAEREEFFYYSDAVIEGKTVFFHLKNRNFSWNSYSDLTEYRLGGVLGYQYIFDGEPGIRMDRVNDELTNFKKLLAGRIDAFPSDRDVAYTILNSNFSDADINRVTYHSKPTQIAEYHVLFSKEGGDSSRRLRDTFNEGLAELKASGRYDAILEAFQSGDYQ